MSAREDEPATSLAARAAGVRTLSEVDFLHLLLDRRALEQRALYAALQDRDARLREIERSASWRLATRLARLARLARRSPADDVQAASPTTTDDTEYARWIAEFDTVPAASLVTGYLAGLAHRPVVSILTALPGPANGHLEATVASLKAQHYHEWQLILLDQGGADEEELDLACRSDPRVRRAQPSTALQAGIPPEATGELIGWVEPGDLLRPHSLAWMVAALLAQPAALACYSDEDQLRPDGTREHPHWKPDFDPLLALQTPYVDRLLLLRRGAFPDDLVAADPGTRWMAVLRIAARRDPDLVVHVPAVLYHRRPQHAFPSPTPPAAPLRALEERGLDAELVRPPGRDDAWVLRIRPRETPRVSILIPTRNRSELLAACLASLERTTYPNYEVVVIDNGSDESETLRLLAEVESRPRHRVLSYPAPFHYSAMHNWAIAQLDSPYVCLVNNDVEVREGSWLSELVGLASEGSTAAVGALLLYPDGSVQHGGVVLGIRGESGHRYRGVDPYAPAAPAALWHAQRLSAVTGAVMLLERDAFVAVGGFDEGFAVSFGDIDLCLALRRAGYEVRYTPLATLTHLESRSRGRDVTPQARARHGREVVLLWRKWGAELDWDPAWNPNLSLADESGALAWPPRTVPPWRPSIQRRPFPCPEPSRYFPLTPIELAPGGTLRLDLEGTAGATQLCLWVMDQEPQGTSAHRLTIGGEVSEFTCSWLHTEPITLALPRSLDPGAPLLAHHEGRSSLIVEAVSDQGRVLVRAELLSPTD
jgi:GT2 family glycosyltransferase